MTQPTFVIMGLPRSRTTWLSKFLTYGGVYCGHDELQHMRNLADVRSWLSQPMTGTTETMAASYWRLLARMAPEANVVIVRRPVEEVVDDIMSIELFGSGQFDRELLTKAMQRLEFKLNQASKRLNNVLDVNFSDLTKEATCRKIFEHCLPFEWDTAWWAALDKVRVNCAFHAQMRYAAAFGPQFKKFAETAEYTMRADLATQRQKIPDDMNFQEESFETWQRDGVKLFEKHCVEVDEMPTAYQGKNWDLMAECAARGNLQVVTARSNGRMFGYLMTILAPSMETPAQRVAIHTTFFADKYAPGIGIKLQRLSLLKLKERGIDEVFFRAGPRGSGPKMGPLYKRLGAQPDGELYRLTFNEVA